MSPRCLVVATHNRAKAREIAELLAAEDLPVEALSLGDFPGVSLPPEVGLTFAENAAAKARHTAEATGLAALADDSGLEVDALGGRPGVYSARYAGEGASDQQRCQKLLAELRGVPAHRRGARFRCAAAYAEPGGATLLAEGTCDGRIAERPAGAGGFGYDPVFIPQGRRRTMAQLSPAEKHAISHRGRAFRLLARAIREHLKRQPADDPVGP